MLDSLHTQGVLHRLCINIGDIMQAGRPQFLNDLAGSLQEAEQLMPLAPPQALAMPSTCYTRHLVYADELGRYSIMLLVWHPGQHSPVHGHNTWCAYKVLQGELTECHYAWRADTGTAGLCGQVKRQRGAIATAPAGLDHIHRLGNESDRVAVSLHIYGVAREQIATHVNLLVPEG